MIKRASSLLLVLMTGLLPSLPASATLSRPNLGDGTQSELWFTVLDATAEASYTLDLGITLTTMGQTNADAGAANALQTAGNNIAASFVTASDTLRDYAFWVIDPTRDQAWAQFSAAANLGTAVWAVMGADTIGSNATPGARRMVMTIGQGGEGTFRNLTNQVFSSLAAPANEFVGVGVNNRPGHAVEDDVTGDLESSIAINGSSFDTKAANPDAYFGKVIDAYAGVNIPGITNPIGQSAWFYDFTRSGSSNLLLTIVDEYDNLAGDAYWGFTAEAGSTGRYLLSYVTPRFVSQVESAAALTFENSFAHLAGVLSVASAVGQTDQVISLTDGFLRRLASRQAAGAQTGLDGLKSAQFVQGIPAAVNAVPEPSAWVLMGLGLAGLAWRARRTR